VQTCERDLERLGYPKTALLAAVEAVSKRGINAGNTDWSVPLTFDGDPSWEAWVHRATGMLLIMWVGPRDVARQLFGTH
jgi:hypothetical protein